MKKLMSIVLSLSLLAGICPTYALGIEPDSDIPPQEIAEEVGQEGTTEETTVDFPPEKPSVTDAESDGGEQYIPAEAENAADVETKELSLAEDLPVSEFSSGKVELASAGDTKQIILDPSTYPESNHNYSNNCNDYYDFSCPTATSLVILFSASTQVESNYDYIYVLDGNGTQVGKYTGTSLSGKTVTVSGDSFRIRLTSDSSQTQYGFSIDKITATVPLAFEESAVVELVAGSSEHGSISFPTRFALKGESFSVTALPDIGYTLKSLTVDNGTANGQTVTILSEGDFTTVTVYAEFEPFRTDVGTVASGTCGTNAGWILFEDGQLYIGGTGTMAGYSSSSGAPWYSHATSISSVSIADGITGIGTYAFSGLTELTEYTIPSNITSIGSNAFNGCTGLRTVTIPDSVTSIGSGVFSGCVGLESITLPFIGASRKTTSNTYQYPLGYIFGTASYTGGTATTQYYYGSSTSSTTSSTYYIPTSLKTVYVAGGEILRGAFYNCSNIMTVALPAVSTINSYAFNGCSSLSDVFYDGESKNNVSIMTGNTYLSSAYWHYVDGVPTIVPLNIGTIENGSISLSCKMVARGETLNLSSVITAPNGGYRFKGYTVDNGSVDGTIIHISDSANYSSVTIGAEFEAIYEDKTLVTNGTCGSGNHWDLYADGELYIFGTGAMSNYSSGTAPWYSYRTYIKKVTIEPGVTSIGSYAFYGFTGLTDITIPGSITSIGEYALAGCTVLGKVSIPSGVSTMGRYVFANDEGLISAGPSGENNIEFAWSEALPSNAFYGCSKIEAVTLPDGMTEIGSSAFNGCAELTSVSLPDTLATIGASAFSGCVRLSTLELPTSVDTVGAEAFLGCSVLGEIVIPSGVTQISNSLFKDCASLTDITIPNTVTSIGTNAFYGCSSLVDCALPTSIGSIGAYAFYGCSEITQIVIPAGVTSIGDHTFYGCSKLESVAVPSSVTAIGSYAFYNCGSLTDVAVPDGVTAIADYTFYGCGQLAELIIPTGVQSIGAYAFYSCGSLSEMALPQGVQTIGSCAFNRCANLSSVTIPSTVTSFSNSTSNGAFVGCSKLNTVGPIGGGYDVEYGWATSIPSYAFTGCTSITSINLADGMTTVGGYAFYGCLGLKYVTMTKSLKTISSYAFHNCSGINTVFYIGSEIFKGGLTIQSNNTNLENATWSYLEGDAEIRSITIGTVEHGSISVSSASATDGTIIKVTTTPDEGYYLQTVLVDGLPITGTSFTVTGNHVVTAQFSRCREIVLDPSTYPESDHSYPNNADIYYDFSCPNATSMEITFSTSTYTESSYDYIYIFNADGTQMGRYTGSELAGQTISVTGDSFRIRLTSDGSNTAYGFSIDSITALVANPEYVVTLVAAPCKTGVITLPASLAFKGDTVEVSATPNVGYKFKSISVDHGTVDGLRITIPETGDFDTVTVTAEFELIDATRTILASGICNSTINWILYDDGELYIYGEGAMENYNYQSINDWYVTTAPWRPYYTDIQFINISSGITSVGNHAFRGCKSVSEVTIPVSVTSLGNSAFCGCSNLEAIEIPDSVTSVGEYVFNVCTQLNSAVLPSNLTNISNGMFSGCDNLSSIAIPSSVTSIGSDAFYSCDTLTTIIIPANVTSIGGEAFRYCPNLKSIEFLGNAPVSVGSSAFPSKSVGEFVIYYHSGTTGWTSPTWNGYYTSCIENISSEFSSLNENNRNGQNILFTLNDDSNTATVGNNSTNNNNCGYNGNNNGAVVIPATVNKGGKSYRVIGINQYAFSGNKLLSTLEIGQNITSVDPTAFINCASFTAFSVNAGNTHYKADGGILYDTSKFNLYVYPYAKTGDTFTVPASVTTIGANAFSRNPYLKEITVPSTVASIGQGAFGGCSSLKKITLPYIGGSLDSEQAFSYVFGSNYYYDSYLPQSLKEVVITGGTLHGSSFYNCSYLESINLPSNDTEIPYRCFSGCASLKTLYFSDMSEAPEAGHLIIPDRIAAIREDSFRGCTALKIVEIPATTAIGYQDYRWENGNRVYYWTYSPAFNGCTNLEEYRVAGANPYLCSDQWGVLYSKDKKTLCDYPSARKWPYYNVAEQTEIISQYAFNTCPNLVNLYIPNTVTTINSSAITNCPGMTVCAYLNSAAYTYAGNNNIPSWAMDNYRLQGIEIYALPEKTVSAMGQEDFSGMYMTMNVGKVLQLDSYNVSYNAKQSGIQTATVSYMGKTATFDILLYNASTEHLVDFGEVNLPNNTACFVAVYDTSGKMVKVETATVMDNHVQIVISNSVLSTLRDVKLFILDNGTFAPNKAPVVLTKQDIEASGS